MLKQFDKAFDFTLQDAEGKAHSLHDYRGKKVVVYFYPKDNTPGCTVQACAFRDAYADFNKLDVVVIGISKDSQKSHEKFVEKFNLPFILLSDPEREAIEGFGVWQEKKMMGKTYMGVVRSTFVLDEEGTVIKVYPKASPDKNAKDILAFLREQ